MLKYGKTLAIRSRVMKLRCIVIREPLERLSTGRHNGIATSIANLCSINKNLSSSTIFLQDGLNISELPILVQKASTVNLSVPDAATRNDGQLGAVPLCSSNDISEVVAVQDGLKRCNSVSELFKLLEVIPVDEVVPSVAAIALQRIAILLNRENEFIRETSSKVNGDALVNTFAWRAIVDRLVNTICQGEMPRILFDGLDAAVVVHKFMSAAQGGKDGDDGASFVDRLVNGCLSSVAKGVVSIEDACHLARTLHSMESSSRRTSDRETIVDQLWPSFMDKWQTVDESNVAAVYATLPLFRRSRHLVHDLLQKRVYDFWWKLKPVDVPFIVDTLASSVRFPPRSFLTLLAKWFSLNIHTISPSNVVAMLASLRRLDHSVDACTIGRTLERYAAVRSRTSSGSHLNGDSELMASLADFCVHFRYSSPIVLDSLATWFQSPLNRSASTADQIFRMTRAFGVLNHVPGNAAGVHLFAVIEESIESRFAEFRPEDLVEMLLAFTHVQRYPLNFVQRIFNPFFMDRLNALQDEMKLRRAMLNLRLLDDAMTLECPRYDGPRIHGPWTPHVARRDGRLVRIHSWLDDDFSKVLDGRHKFATMKHLADERLTSAIACDFVFDTNEDHRPLPFHEKNRDHERTIVIIHLPEDYAVDRRCLLGRPAARLRHLDRIGYRIVQCDYEKLESLKCRSTGERLDFLRNLLLPLENTNEQK